MRFIYNRGSIIFIICGFVSLVPTALASSLVVFSKTFNISSLHPASSIGPFLLFLTPFTIYLMGDILFYTRVVKHQQISQQEKIQLVIGFMMVFVTIYCVYFFLLDMVSALFDMINRL